MDVLRKMNIFFISKDDLNLGKLILKYKGRHKAKAPHKHIIKHLMKLTSLFNKNDGDYYKSIVLSLIQNHFPNYHDTLINLRKNTLCMMCDWNS